MTARCNIDSPSPCPLVFEPFIPFSNPVLIHIQWDIKSLLSDITFTSLSLHSSSPHHLNQPASQISISETPIISRLLMATLSRMGNLETIWWRTKKRLHILKTQWLRRIYVASIYHAIKNCQFKNPHTNHHFQSLHTPDPHPVSAYPFGGRASSSLLPHVSLTTVIPSLRPPPSSRSLIISDHPFSTI